MSGQKIKLYTLVDGNRVSTYHLLPVLYNWHSVQLPPCAPDPTAGHSECSPPAPGPQGPDPAPLAAPEFSWQAAVCVCSSDSPPWRRAGVGGAPCRHRCPVAVWRCPGGGQPAWAAMSGWKNLWCEERERGEHHCCFVLQEMRNGDKCWKLKTLPEQNVLTQWYHTLNHLLIWTDILIYLDYDSHLSQHRYFSSSWFQPFTKRIPFTTVGAANVNINNASSTGWGRYWCICKLSWKVHFQDKTKQNLPDSQLTVMWHKTFVSSTWSTWQNADMELSLWFMKFNTVLVFPQELKKTYL